MPLAPLGGGHFSPFEGPKCLNNASKNARPDSYASDTYSYLSDTI
jgi:hypothetical protein